jgi:PIN domain nuclease of toxin-antitoxin system
MISSPEKLSEPVEKIIESKENQIFLSAVSGLEITIKFQINKLELPDRPDIYIPQQMKENIVEVLPIRMNHVLNVYNLPDIHKDPFDRLLISQSQLENLPLLTNDSKIKQYPVERIW